MLERPYVPVLAAHSWLHVELKLTIPLTSASAFGSDRYNKTLRSEVSLSAYAFMISEIISYCQSRVDSIQELEAR